MTDTPSLYERALDELRDEYPGARLYEDAALAALGRKLAPVYHQLSTRLPRTQEPLREFMARLNRYSHAQIEAMRAGLIGAPHAQQFAAVLSGIHGGGAQVIAPTVEVNVQGDFKMRSPKNRRLRGKSGLARSAEAIKARDRGEPWAEPIYWKPIDAKEAVWRPRNFPEVAIYRGLPKRKRYSIYYVSSPLGQRDVVEFSGIGYATLAEVRDFLQHHWEINQ